MTQAEQIATMYHNDGQRWTDGSGHTLIDALDAHVEWPHHNGDATRWQLRDGSAIVTTDGGWDLGIQSTEEDDRSECTCWSDDQRTCREPDNCACGCHEE